MCGDDPLSRPIKSYNFIGTFVQHFILIVLSPFPLLSTIRAFDTTHAPLDPITGRVPRYSPRAPTAQVPVIYISCRFSFFSVLFSPSLPTNKTNEYRVGGRETRAFLLLNKKKNTDEREKNTERNLRRIRNRVCKRHIFSAVRMRETAVRGVSFCSFSFFCFCFHCADASQKKKLERGGGQKA